MILQKLVILYIFCTVFHFCNYIVNRTHHHHGILSANTTSRMESSANGMRRIFSHHLFVASAFYQQYSFLSGVCHHTKITEFTNRSVITFLNISLDCHCVLSRNDIFCLSGCRNNGCPIHLQHLLLDPGDRDILFRFNILYL